MTPTKLLIGPILIVFGIVVLCDRLPRSGRPQCLAINRSWASHGSSWVRWPSNGNGLCLVGDHYEAYAPQVFDAAGALAGASGFAGCAVAIFGSLWRARQKGRVITYGSARWAHAREMNAAGYVVNAPSFSDAGAVTISVTRGPSMSWRSRRRGAGRAWASLSP